MANSAEGANYSFRMLDHRNHLIRAEVASCIDDADANTRGKYRANGHAVEVWQAARFVNRWERMD